MSATIEKSAGDETRTAKSVDQLLAEYDSPDACVAELLCDRHDPEATAFTVVSEDEDGALRTSALTYGELKAHSEKVAAALADLGVGEGDAVATLMGKSAELVGVMLGIWRLGAVYVPLFTAFAWPAIEMRLEGSRAKVIVSDPGQREKIEGGDAQIVVAGSGAATDSALRAGDLRLDELTSRANWGERSAARVGSGATMVVLYTSGTTGRPKGVVIPVRALTSFHQYMEIGLDMHPEDVFWNSADPGWAYGLYYGIMGPMALGLPNILLTAAYSPALALRVFEECGVTNFAAAPTVYRTIRAHAAGAAGPAMLRCASSAGEPLTPEIIEWGKSFFGSEVRDHYGQTEHGMFIVNPWHPQYRNELRTGSMGVSLPGWESEVLDPVDDRPMEPAAAGDSSDDRMGRVAIDMSASALKWFAGYLDAPEKTAERFSADGRWYYTGDAGKRGQDGLFYFASRDDDVVIMAGYRIGPFDVESVLVQDPEVIEAAAIGVPDELRGEVLESYVVLRDGIPDAATAEATTARLQQLVKTGFAAHAYPRRIHYVAELPKTPSGKIQRFLLRKERAAQS